MSSPCADPTDQCPYAKGTLGQHRAQGERRRKVKGQGDASTSQRTPRLREAPSARGRPGETLPVAPRGERALLAPELQSQQTTTRIGFNLESTFN